MIFIMSFSNRKVIIYLIWVTFVVLWLFLNWYITRNSPIQIKKQLDAIDITWDIKIEKQVVENSFTWKNIHSIKKLDFTWKVSDLLSWFLNLWNSQNNVDLSQLKRLYTMSLINWDQVAQLQILLAMYDLNKDKNILWLWINKAILLNQFDLALKLMKIYYKWNFQIVSKDEAQKLLYVLINTEYFVKNKKEFQSLLKYLNKNHIIDEQDYIFYSSFYLPLSLDFTGYYNVIKFQLLTWKYSDFARQILKQYDIFRQYRDVSFYYLPSLIAYVWFNEWYFYPSYLLALKVLKYSSSYLLPLQIVAYNLYIFQKQQAVDYLKKLQDLDKDNSDFYRFLMWVLLYDLRKYADVILYLNPLLKKEDFIYKDDVRRYLFLSYVKLWDFSRAFGIFKNFLDTKQATVYDFWTFFNYFLYNDRWYEIVSNNKQDIVKIIKQCYKNVGKHYVYVCRYWKWLFYYRLGYVNKAVRYFKYLVKFYPKPIFFKFLGDYYSAKWNYKLAKKYYLYWLQYSQENDLRNYFRKKLLNLLKKEF